MREISEKIKNFKKNFETFTRAKTPLEIDWFILGRHESRHQQYKQLCLQAEDRYRALHEAEYGKKKTEIEIEELQEKLAALCEISGESSSREREKAKTTLELSKKKADLDHLDHLMLGALKELADYVQIAETRFSDLMTKSEDEFYNEGERTYWIERMSRQIQVDLAVYGRIQEGNLSSLLMMPDSERMQVLLLSSQKQDEFLKLAGSVDAIHQANQKTLEESSKPKLLRGKNGA